MIYVIFETYVIHVIYVCNMIYVIYVTYVIYVIYVTYVIYTRYHVTDSDNARSCRYTKTPRTCWMEDTAQL